MYTIHWGIGAGGRGIRNSGMWERRQSKKRKPTVSLRRHSLLLTKTKKLRKTSVLQGEKLITFLHVSAY